MTDSFWWSLRFMQMGDVELAPYQSAEATLERIRRINLEGYEPLRVSYVDSDSVFFNYADTDVLQLLREYEDWRGRICLQQIKKVL